MGLENEQMTDQMEWNPDAACHLLRLDRDEVWCGSSGGEETTCIDDTTCAHCLIRAMEEMGQVEKERRANGSEELGSEVSGSWGT